MITKKLDVRIGKNAMPVGELIFEASARKQSSMFRYYDAWLENPKAFPIAPSMPLQDTPFYTVGGENSDALPMAVADGTPDSWGRSIIRQSLKEADQSRKRYVTDLDYLIEVDDILRAGALRYFDSQDNDLAALATPRERTIPQVVNAYQLFAAAKAFEEDPTNFTERRAVLMGLRDNVGSLGGARPKVNVREKDNSLWIAKLPKNDDFYGVARVEVMTLKLAAHIGLRVAEAKLLNVGDKYPIALIRRFDRGENDVEGRIPFISAQTFMNLEGTTPGNYVDIALQIREHGSSPDEDVRELYKRLMFSSLVSNCDDHLRNHGFLYQKGGWRLSPAFDINPVPEPGQTFKTAISEIHGFEPSIELVIDAAPFFDIELDDAAKMAHDMATSISDTWRNIGEKLGMTAQDFRSVSVAFTTLSMNYALGLSPKINP